MEIDVNKFVQLTQGIKQNIQQVIVGKDEAIENILVCLVANGHVLIEDVPGIGKTTLVHALAKSVNLSFKRIQFTPDLMPADVTGFNLYNPALGQFVFQPGAAMSNIILADEINRTSPKTQSALLEAMQESQVTVDSISYPLEKPYMVLATQNPIEHLGTYPLPEAQLDRFMMKIDLGYPSKDEEVDILSVNMKNRTVDNLEQVCSRTDVLWMQEQLDEVYVKNEIKEYVVDLVRQTRNKKEILIGASPRASQMLMKAAMARALVKGRDFVLPEDVKALATKVLCHRIVLKQDRYIEATDAEKIVLSILESTSIKIK